jgi:ABC-2 type transport system ATP-binding protein
VSSERQSGPGLELDGLSRRYGETTALDGLSLSVPPGQVVGFVGPNGAGKTTAMRIILGVLEPDQGDIRWDGRPADEEARRRFGYMPEERGLYPKMRVNRHLAYLARLHGADPAAAEEAARRWTDRLGLGERREAKVQELSLGNQQRVQLAAALVHDPDLLVLDEPFSGLDPIGVDVMSEVLSERAQRGAAVVFSSHQLDLVERVCDAVTIVSEGRVVAAGDVDELRAGAASRRMRVELAEADPAWADDVDGARLLDRDGRGWTFELEPRADEQKLLYAAQVAGRLRHFSEVRPTLAELFRDVVQAGR